MSDIARRPAGEVAVRPQMTQELIDGFFDSPINQIPASWRPHVLNFWMQFQALQGAQDGFGMLCARLRIWRDYGMKYSDLDHAMRSLMHPSRAGGFKYASDVVNAVSAIVSRHMERRTSVEEMRRFEREKLDPEAIHAALRQIIEKTEAHVAEREQSDSSQSPQTPDAGRAARGPIPGPARPKSKGSQ